ncbi:hypothetical protein VNO80_20711 [Phaseolus coccineus]|uniref:Uncharacterized protein n=1 Tax=Phaseolus coccineus TaxID=3886 RepID=A0AAN9M2F1_PHACN
MHCVYGFRSIPFMAVPRVYNFVSFIAFLLSSGSLAFSVLEDILSSFSSEPVIYLKALPGWQNSGSNDEDHMSDTMLQPKENVQSVKRTSGDTFWLECTCWWQNNWVDLEASKCPCI